MKALVSWFADRTSLGKGLTWLADSPVPGGACWCQVWPATILFLVCVQAITGFILWTYYSPSAQTAWESVYFVQYHVLGGWLLRAMHHYSAHVLLGVLIIFVVQTIVTRACRAPRELVFWIIVGLGLCALAAALTGDLLAWDRNGYAATKTRTGFLTMLPLVGDGLLKLAIGGPGPALGHHSLTRFFALHVGLFGAGLAVLLALYVVFARRAAVVLAADEQAEPYWPRQAWRSAAACLAVMVVVLALCLQHGARLPQAGAPLGSPADTDPANAYAAARPEWFLVGVYEFSHLFPGQWGIMPIFIVPGGLVCILLLMPFAARYLLGHIFNLVFTAAVLIALVVMSWVSLAKDRADPAYRAAVAAEEQQAERVCQLAEHLGIPATGGLTLLHNDPKTEGPRLFVQHCDSCHSHAGDRAAGGDIAAEKPSAPNLAGFASRGWLAGLLDPKQIGGPAYFGNTRFRSGKMVGFVKDTLADQDESGKKDLQRVIKALSAEAELASQRELDAKDAQEIAEGRKLIVGDFGCTDCHQFHDKGALGKAPKLTGYGSPQWIAGLISNPADKHYYGNLNDRMPAYAPSSAPTQNLLTVHQIKMLCNWLRGEWWEEGVRGQGSEVRD